MPTITIADFVTSSLSVCAGEVLRFTATLGNVGSSYSYSLSNGSDAISGYGTGVNFDQSLTAISAGPQTFTLTVVSNTLTGSASTSVTVGRVPTNSSLTGGTLSCTQTSLTLTASAIGGSSYSFSTGASQIGSTNQAVVNQAGEYTVIISSVDGCTVTQTTQVFSSTTAPSVSMSASGSLSCSQTSVMLTAEGGSAYFFSGPGIVSQANNTATVNQPGQYSVTVTGTNGCTATTSTEVLEDVNSPVSSITPSNATLTCTNPSVTLTASGSGTYRWSTGATSSTISVGTSGTYSVTVTGTNGCTASASIDVLEDVNPPIASITPSNATLTCANPSVTLTAGGGGTYHWNTGETTAQISVTSTGTYSVTITGSNGCTATNSVIIEQDNSVPSVSINASSTLLTCATPTISLSATGSGTYRWSTGATSSTIDVSTADIYSVTLTGTNGCTASASIDVMEDSNSPVASIAPSSTTLTCASQSVTLTASGGGTYHWSTGENTAQISTTVAGTYSVTVTGTNGCTATTSVQIQEDVTPPIASITPSSTTLTCASPSVTLTAGGGGTYHWTTGENTTAISATAIGTYSVTVTSANGCTTTASAIIEQDNSVPTISINPSSTTLTCASPTVSLSAVGIGTYRWSTGATSSTISVSTADIYSVTVTGANGCTASASVQVSQDNSAPSVSVNPTSATLTCTNPTASLSAVGSGTYRWSTNATTPVISVGATGTYSVTVTGANGCTASASVQVSQDNSAPSVSVNPISATLTCANTSATLTANGSGTYRWNTGATSSTISVSVSGTYSVTLTGTNGCTASTSAQVGQNSSAPSASITPSSATLTCASQSVTLTAGGGGTYRWSTGEVTAQISATAVGTYSVTVTGGNGCTATQSASVFANTSTPTVSLSVSGMLSCSLTSVTLTASGGVTYLFNGPGVVSQSANKAVVNLAGIYSVTATAANGCTASTTALVSSRNCPPTVVNMIPPQSATILLPFTYTIPANTFTDPETPNSLTLSVTGLPKGLSFTAPATISGTPLTESGTSFSVIVTAVDPGGLSTNTILQLSIYPGLQTCDMYTLKAGNWNDTSVWSCGRLPVSTDVITLKHAVSIPASYVGQVLRIQYSINGKIIFNSGSRLKQGIF